MTRVISPEALYLKKSFNQILKDKIEKRISIIQKD